MLSDELTNPNAYLLFFNRMTKMPFVFCSYEFLMSYEFQRNFICVMLWSVSYQILPRLVDFGKTENKSVDSVIPLFKIHALNLLERENCLTNFTSQLFETFSELVIDRCCVFRF